ncbi:MAG: NYN domain-containing protein [Erysipelotrichaceae bacterium]|nr:NYN domain-containing protein [Erysipelotrichaceae bacterium]
MSRIIIGAYAHVDGGKTTLSECILHKCGVLKESGRVDHEDSFLDFNAFERKKGITVFAKEARFSYRNKDFIYVDTPGHLDFIGEVNRSFAILDAAILIIDGTASIPADTIHRFRYLKSLEIPILIFINKMDISHRSYEEILEEIHRNLSLSAVAYQEIEEHVALDHEELLDRYLQDGHIDDSQVADALREGLFYPVFSGSALHEEGVEELLDFLSRYIDVPTPTDHLKAYIYKIDEYAHVKVFSGTLKNRDTFGDHQISQIVQFNGNKTTQVSEVTGNDLCAVKGLQGLKAGIFLPSLFCEDSSKPDALSYRLLSDLDSNELYRRISVLNEEFPELNIVLNDSVSIDLSGELQKEFIRQLIKERFNIDVDYSQTLISYKESIEEEVYGVGHYEPLRHYAEVLVMLRPYPSYHVKARKEFSVLMDYLEHRRPCGILTDSPLDNIEIEILETRTHLKHTEGGDLIQALNRAIRQALTKAKNYLLEPYYLLSLTADPKTLNGIISELSARQYVFDIEDSMIMAKIPKIGFNDLILSLRNRYHDDFSHEIEGSFYDRCRNEDEVIRQIAYDYRNDPYKQAGSIFTRNGAGTYFAPEEVEEIMHIDLKNHFSDYKPIEKHRARTINEEELKRVWNSLYKPRPRYVEKHDPRLEEKKKENIDTKELLYMIDGYNVLHAMEDAPLDNLTMGREKVIDLACDFAGYVSASLVLIFDAYLQESAKATVSERDNITIVYTRNGQTADMFIEEKVKELGDRYRIIVVTSDNLEQLSVFSAGAFRLSSREFLARYSNMRKNMTHSDRVFNRPLEELRKLLDL